MFCKKRLKHDKRASWVGCKHKKDLKLSLLPYEIPMKINIVDKLQITDTGKISRK